MPVVGITARQAWRGLLWTWGRGRGVTPAWNPETHRASRWCVLMKQAGVSLTTIAIYFTNSHPEGELRPTPPHSTWREKEVCSLFSSAQLVFASQNLHFEKKMNGYDLDVHETSSEVQEALWTDGPGWAQRLGPCPHHAPKDFVSC